jgi:hypothetical protein
MPMDANPSTAHLFIVNPRALHNSISHSSFAIDTLR